MNLFFNKKNYLLNFFLLLLLAFSFSNAEIITGTVYDSELDIPVKNVKVVLKNVQVLSNDSGEFRINTDEVSVFAKNINLNSKTKISFNSASQSVNIIFPQKKVLNTLEIRNIKGKSLFKIANNKLSNVSIPLREFAHGMYVLTIKDDFKINHYWINNTVNGNSIIKETTDKNDNKITNQNRNRDAANRADIYNITFSKPGYDTLSKDFDDISNSLVVKMDRFEFCGNDVAEGDEVCDGDEFPCNVLNPLDYAIGNSFCNNICSGYNEDDCVPHPDIDVSGNFNGENHKNALDITSLAHYNILQQIQVGMIEGNFHDIIDSVYNTHGASGVAFNHITGSGPNSIILHYEGKNRTLQDGDVLLVDIGAKYNGYCADVTRTYPVNGHYSDRQKEVYQLVLDAKNAAANEMVANNHSLNQMTTFVKNFFRASPLRAKDKYGTERTMDYFFVHGLCHYVGKDVHGSDLGFSNSDPVRPGRIFTIEPGLYIESEGFGIRLEDTYIMTNSGAENIMPNIAIEVEHVEAIMAARKLDRSAQSYKHDYEETKSISTHMNF